MIMFAKIIQSIFDKVFSIILIVVGFVLLVEGIPTKTIEIDPTGPGVTAFLHKTSPWPPFMSNDEFVPNVKQAVVTVSDSREMTYYYVELETTDGRKVPITYKSMFSAFKEILKDKINKSIQNKTPFKQTFRETSFLFFGFLFIVVSLSMIFSEQLKRTYKEFLKEEDEDSENDNDRKTV